MKPAKPKKEEEDYKEYKILLDVLDEHYDKQVKLEDTIKALKTNPQYRAMFRKDYLESKEKDKKKIDIIIKALNHLRDTENGHD